MSKRLEPAEPRVEIMTVLGIPSPTDEARTRGATSALDGAWLGAFAHSYFGPLVVTGYEAAFAGEGGHFRDRHGEGTLRVHAFDGRHVIFTKRYPRGASFCYRGELVGDSLAGYWESEGRVRTRGLFALRRAESLPSAERERLVRGAVKDRRAFFFFALPMLVPLVLLFVFYEALGGLRYALGFTGGAILLAILGHAVLPHNRLLARVRGRFPAKVSPRAAPNERPTETP